MSSPPTTIRIFISSPGDVTEERDKARRVIDRLQRHYTGATLQPVLWEDLALPATASFQESIEFILNKNPIDIAVFILWSRLGSPLGAAITRPDGTPYLSGTEREFDLMLTAFDQSGKKRPLIFAYTRRDEAGYRQKFMDSPRTRLEELLAQQKLAENFIREQFKDAEGHNLRAYTPYTEPVSFAQRLHTHLRQVLDELLGGDAAPRWLDEPYRGLEVFNVEHAPIFQGRDEETCDVLQRLRDQEQAGCAFVVVVGASGSGKSSLARAGVAATLTQHPYDDRVKTWRVVTFFPALGASELNLRLTRSLAEQLPELNSSATALDDIANGLAKDAALTVKLSIAPAFARADEAANGAVRILLLVDQMEELWTDRRITDEDRERFLDVLEALARSGHITVLATLRSDFYPHAQRIPAFLRLKGDRGHCDLLAPGAAALQRLITEPARLAGLQFEREEQTGRTLDQRILQDASRDPAALPLLQYALSELYQQRDTVRRELTFAAYEKLGGVEGALGKRAAEMFQGLPPDVRAALPEILPLLVTVDVSGEQAAVRRRAPLAELTATPTRRLLTESLIAARFLTTDRQDDTPIVSLAHEALVRRWDELANWVASNRDQLRMRASVEQSQQRWVQLHREVSLLLPTGLLLEEGRTLLYFSPHLLTDEIRDYIGRSIAFDDSQKRRNRQKRRAVVAVLSIFALLAMTGTIVAWKQRELAEKQRREAEQHLNANQRTLAQIHFERGLTNEREGQHRNSLVEFFLAAKTIPEDALLAKAYQRILIDRLTQSSALILPPFVHDGEVYSVAFSPDGTRVVTGSEDKTARLWNAQTGFPIGAAMQHEGEVWLVAFSSDGTRVVTGSNDHTARLWNAHTGAAIGEIMTHESSVRSVTFSPDGKRVVTGSSDNTARLWDAQTGAMVGAVMKHEDQVRSAAFSLDGTRVITGSDDKTVRLWDAQTGAAIGAVMKHDGKVCSVALSADSTRVIAGCDDNTAQLWDAGTGNAIDAVMKHTNQVWHLAFSPDSTRVATGDWGGTVRLWNAQTGAPLGVLMKHDSSIGSIAFSPDGTHILTGDWDGMARLWDAHTGVTTGVLMKHDAIVRSIAFSPDGTCVVTGSGDNTARLWNAQTETPVVAVMKHSRSIDSVAFSPDGTRVVTTSDDKSARIWDVQTGDSIGAVMEHADSVTVVAFSPDGTRVVTGSKDNSARMWDAQTGESIGMVMEHGGNVTGVAFSPDSTRVVTTSDDKTARMWDAQTGESTGMVMKHLRNVTSVAFSSDGTRVVTGSDDNTTWQWHSRTGAFVSKHTIHESGGRPVVFSPDGTRAVIPTYDGTTRLWDVKTGTSVGVALKHNDFVSDLRFCSDGSRLVTGSFDKTVRLWDTETGTSIGAVMLHEDKVRRVGFSPDGMLVVTGCNDKTTRLWDAQTGAMIGTVIKHEANVAHIGFSPDGMRLVTTDFGGEVRLWDVGTPMLDAISSVQLHELFEIMSGSRVTLHNPQESVPIATDEFMQLIRSNGNADRLLQLERKRRNEFALGRTLFHIQCAEDQENWFAVAFHLRRLSEMEPEKGNVWHRLGGALAQQRKWGEAVTAFQSAVGLEPSIIDWKYDLSLACLATGDAEQFHAAAESLLAVAVKSEMAYDWDSAVWLLALSRPDSISTDRIVPLARRAVEKEPENWSYRETLGATLFRAGDYANAFVELEKALVLHTKAPSDDNDNSDAQPVKPTEGTVWTQTFLALTHHALGNSAEATSYRALAEQLAKDSPSTEWRERLRRELLLQELTESLGPAVTDGSPDEVPVDKTKAIKSDAK